MARKSKDGQGSPNNFVQWKAEAGQDSYLTSSSSEDAWFSVDLGARRSLAPERYPVAPTLAQTHPHPLSLNPSASARYSLRNDSHSTYAMRNWTLEGAAAGPPYD